MNILGLEFSGKSSHFSANKIINPNFHAPSKRQFLEIRNQHKILRKKVGKKFYFFVKTPKNNFSDPQSTNPNKTSRKHF